MMTMRIRVTSNGSDAGIAPAEIAAAVRALREGDDGAWGEGSVPDPPVPTAIGGFAHVGSITEQGRVSYTKFTAVFSAARYPGSNCGISILGA